MVLCVFGLHYKDCLERISPQYPALGILGTKMPRLSRGTSYNKNIPYMQKLH